MSLKQMSKLKKMKMPEKKGEDMSQMEGSPEEEAGEDMATEDAEDSMDPNAAPMPEHGAPHPELEALSDEDLMAEIKKRGLMSQLEQHGEAAADEGQDDHSIMA